MNALQQLRTWAARAIAPRPAPLAARIEPTVEASRQVGKRIYQGADFSRTTADWVTLGSSTDSETRISLRGLRNRVRQLVRDNDYAKNAVRAVVNNVVGTGARFQSQVTKRGGKLDADKNAAIEESWARWCKKGNCDVAGRLSFAELQRTAMRAVVESGEVIIRRVPGRFGNSTVPLALEIIESDQLVEWWSGRAENGNEVRMGVEVDAWQRPLAYYLYPRHPGDYQFAPGAIPTNRLQRVPAGEIFHLYVGDRPGATRGVPWLHSAMVRLNHLGGYEEAELIAARGSAAIMGFIETADLADPTTAAAGSMNADDVMDGQRVFDMEPGVIKELAPGEKFSGFTPSRPNTGMDSFMRLMLRGVAAGIGLSYETISRDYSQSNYSSSRLALLDDRDNWRMLQSWFREHFLQDVYEAWLDQAVLTDLRDVLPDYFSNATRYHGVRWMFRGWDWVDPWKEVQAARTAIRSGLQTVQGALAARGEDFEDVFTQRRRELDLASDLGLVMDTDPAQVNDKGIAQPVPAAPESDTGAVSEAALETDGGADGQQAGEDGSDATDAAAKLAALSGHRVLQ